MIDLVFNKYLPLQELNVSEKWNDSSMNIHSLVYANKKNTLNCNE